jgi:acyl dehydratase
MISSNSNILSLQEGDTLPEVMKQLNQEKINRYAEAVGDFNPIHIDEAFAAQTMLGGTIAHGMLVLAYVSEMMTQAFGESWLSNGKLSVRFKAPAHSKDTITVSGRIESAIVENDNTAFTCSVDCRNQEQETLITGEAVVRVRVN